MEANRNKLIVKASWVAIVGNAILSALKIVIGLFSGSFAVVADGIDSASDVVTSFITLITARILIKPPNIKYPYGYNKADTIATKLLSFIIFFAGAQLGISTISDLMYSKVREMPSSMAIYVTIFSIGGKLLLSLYLKKVGHKTQSEMLKANARNMTNDILISFSVLAGLFFTIVLEMPILDRITALAVSIFIMKAGFEIFMETSRDLMDGMQDTEIYQQIFESVAKVEGAYNPHRTRVRKLGSLYVIGIDIEVDGDLSLNQAHLIAHQVEESIRRDIENIYDIVVHTEPIGMEDSDEKFGISHKDVM
ncbi:MAG: cation transporter [Bacteroidales bacterium]|nr:cation transporter [Bacteroidales bacterium]